MKMRILQRLLGKLAMIAPGGYSLRPWLHKMRGVQMGERVWIGQYVYIDELHPEKVSIEDNAVIGFRCTIFAHFYTGAYSPGARVGKVQIKSGAFLGPNCTVLNDVVIGEGSVVVAGSVVTRNVPAGVVYGPPPPGPLARITHPLIKAGQVEYGKFLCGLKKIGADPDPSPRSALPADYRQVDSEAPGGEKSGAKEARWS
ncbi:MAG: acetyltransferase [Geobacteraceae bacterium GWC2_58_44]|nr:MAG: acetyltransferase [Geobacteraceae bacterium GWC2_58_44]HBG05646.1 acetyltransferase [Geobacter sp.]